MYAKDREKIIEYAKKQIGVPYVWSGNDPKGFDCSGFTGYVMKEFGKELSRRAVDQFSGARKVKEKNVQKGDLVFFDNGSGISHVGMIVSDKGKPLVMIHASSSKGIIITEIENLINVDEQYYRVYCLGERPISTTRIYSHFKQYVDEVEYSDHCYGLDIGYNHAMALIKVKYSGEKIYVNELLYENKLTISDLMFKVKDLIKDRQPIYVDSARPDVIEELRIIGLNSQGSNKQVKEGIDYVKSKEIYIHTESVNLWKEYKLYSWKSKGDQIFDEPIKMNDDGLDALRYGIFTHKKKKFNSEYTKIFIV
jgi:phage terminase large subunit